MFVFLMKNGNATKTFRKISIIVIVSTVTLFLVGSGCNPDPKVERLNYLKDQHIVAEYQQYDEDVILVKERYVHDYGKITIYCDDLQEAKEYMNIGTKTYDDVIELYKTKTGITSEERTVILNGLKRMKKELPDLDVTVLYYNTEMVSFKRVNQAEMDKILGYSGKDACFDYIDYIIYYNPDDEHFTECEFLHEVLGHGSMSTLFNDDDISNKAISFGFDGEMIEFDTEHHYSTYQYGFTFSEASADYIAKVASNSSYNSIYEYAVESLKAISEMTGISVEQLLNMRGRDFYLSMYEKANIDNPIKTTLKLDQVIDDYYMYRMYSRPDYLNNIFSELYLDYSEERVEKYGLSEIDKIKKMIMNDGRARLAYYESYGKNVVAKYDKKIVANEVEEKLKESYGKEEADYE